MSIGLMREVSFDFMERCTKSLYSTGACEMADGEEIACAHPRLLWQTAWGPQAVVWICGMLLQGTLHHVHSANELGAYSQ